MTNQFNNEQKYQQWYRFIQDHGFTWKGILTRYEGDGKISEVLNSKRKFTAAEDAESIEHYLCFINQEDPTKVLEKTFIVDKCEFGVIHPVDPKSVIIFSSYGSGLMSRQLSKEEVNYLEIYLQTDQRRISVVIVYSPEQYNLSRISLFREVKDTTEVFPWSQDQSQTCHRDDPHLEVINNQYLSSETLTEKGLNDYPMEWNSENRLIFHFPDGISLNLPETLKAGQKDDLILSWQYSDEQVKRGIAHFGDDHPLADLITQDCVIK